MPSKETPRQRDLGILMRTLRGNRTQGEIASAMDRNVSHVSRWETGKLLIEEDELRTFLGVVGATADDAVEALQLHRDAADPNWLLPGVGRELALVREYEDSAGHVTNFQPMLYPGPLQTRAMAEFVIRGAGANEEQIADWVEFRMARRNSLLSGSIRYEAIIGEQAIRYPGSPREVAVEQLRDLLKNSILDHISVQVLPCNLPYHPGRHGAFVLFEASEARPVVHLEHYRSSSTLTNSRDVRDYQDAAEAIRRDAMNPEASSRFIADVADKLESTT